MKPTKPSTGNRPRPSTGASRGATQNPRGATQTPRSSGNSPRGASAGSRPANQRATPQRPETDRPQAIQSRVSFMQRLGAYFAHHSHSAADSLLRLLDTPFQSLMTWMVIAIAVALPATLFMAFSNMQRLGENWEGSTQVSVFLRPETTEAKAEDMRAVLAARPEIAKVVYVSPTQGLAEFKTQSGLGEVVDSLEKNPLPGVLLVTPKLQNASDAAITSLEQSLVADPAVADVRLDMQWVKRLQQLMVLGKKLCYGLGGLLALGVLLVIGNTIRLAIENRRDEILVIKLVGGTDSYVARPFLYTGLWYGIGGGLLSLMVLAAGYFWVSSTVDQIASLYQSNFRLQGLGLFGSIQLVLLAGLTGWVGAWIAVTRHLINIQPR